MSTLKETGPGEFTLLPPEEIQTPSGEVLEWTIFDPRGQDLLGYIPNIILQSDPRSARDQINERYAHGGGWSPMEGWIHLRKGKIYYPGDPALKPVAMALLREETIYVYPHAWVMIVQANGDFEVSRMD